MRKRQIQPSNSMNVSKKKVFKIVLFSFLILIGIVVAWIGVTTALAWRSSLAKNDGNGPSFFRFSGNVPVDQLQKEGDSRINFVVAGIGGEGALTDTIQVVSIDPLNKTMSLVSVPRDLIVTLPDKSRGKINAVYVTANNLCAVRRTCQSGVDAGGAALKETLSTVLDVPVQNFIKIDFNGFTQIIDSLGGIDVYVDKPLRDPYFPDARLVGYDPLYISAGQHHFDGKTALKYARSRETTSDFDRAMRQQKVIQAVRERALSLNVLANPAKVTGIISTLGSNLKTDFTTDQIIQVVKLIQSIDSSKTSTLVIDTSNESPLKATTLATTGYSILPKLGFGEYSELHDYVAHMFVEPYIIREAATVTLVNATGSSVSGKKIATTLSSLGYNIVSTVDAPAQKSTTISVNTDKPYTDSLLQKRFEAGIVKTNPYSTDITLTVGTSYSVR